MAAPNRELLIVSLLMALDRLQLSCPSLCHLLAEELSADNFDFPIAQVCRGKREFGTEICSENVLFFESPRPKRSPLQKILLSYPKDATAQHWVPTEPKSRHLTRGDYLHTGSIPGFACQKIVS